MFGLSVRVVSLFLSSPPPQVTLTDSTHVSVSDVTSEAGEELDFRERVVKLSLSYGHLVVATTSQCHVYNVHNWNTPHMFDLRATPTLIHQSERHFLMVDALNGVQLYSYDGRVLSSPKFPGLRAELLSSQCIALAADCVAIVDKSDGGKSEWVMLHGRGAVPRCDGACVFYPRSAAVRLFDVRTGHPIGKVLTHECEIAKIELSSVRVGLRVSAPCLHVVRL